MIKVILLDFCPIVLFLGLALSVPTQYTLDFWRVNIGKNIVYPQRNIVYPHGHFIFFLAFKCDFDVHF